MSGIFMRIRRLIILAFLFSLFLVLPAPNAAQSTQPAEYNLLREGFLHPPDSAKLRCYWWWLNGNTTEETITRDLTEMSLKGFGGVLLVDGNGANQNGNDNVPAGPRFGSPAWMKLYLHALKTAAALHLEVTLNITSGWNTGGPDVVPADASKLLTWSRAAVTNGLFDSTLPAPPIKNGFYRRIAVLAYPLAHGVALPGRNGDHRPAIAGLKFKIAAADTGFSMPPSETMLSDAHATAGEEDADLSSVLDISDKVDDAGRLHWIAPYSGSWEILTIGYTDSDARVSTSSDSWQGLAIDYLDPLAFDRYWDHTVAPILDGSHPYLKTTLVNVATDSWELDGTNWTGKFRDEFQRRRGYDPVPYLPVVAGRIVQDRDTSHRFLNDLRRTVGDLLTEHYDHFAARASEYGLGLQAESGGPHGAPVDALETFRSSTVPQTEYWAPSVTHRSRDNERFFTKEAASAANIYGKRLVANEGMTSIGPQWSESLGTDLKPAFDRAITEGMNRLVWHEFTSSPDSVGLPGYEYFAGTHINPKVTWWQQSGDFFLYFNRVQFLQQQGYAVNDVLYFYGDQVPNFVRLKTDDPSHALPGYDYDAVNQDALLHSLVANKGAFVSPAGNRYRLLAMPKSRRMSLAALERIADYLHQGGIVAGPQPLSATGIVTDQVASRFANLVQDIWGGCVQPVHSYGAGKVFCNSDAHSALKQLNIPEDFHSDWTQLDFVHRRYGGVDIYFVRNQGWTPIQATVEFRVNGRAPELWDPIDGSIQPQAYYRDRNGVTQLPLHLPPYGSTLVVFANPSHSHIERIVKDGQEQESAGVRETADGSFALVAAPSGSYLLQTTNGEQIVMRESQPSILDLPAKQWTVTFQRDRGAPMDPQKLNRFESWTQSDNVGIRYFSGTATYNTTFDFHPHPGDRILLRLTELHEIATVRLNGERMGTIWSAPYQLDLTGKLIEGKNTLELDVTNLWPNRIIGDAQPSANHQYTHTNIRAYNAESPLLPSGLIGPVFLDVKPASSASGPRLEP
jgi:hypothetical protein